MEENILDKKTSKGGRGIKGCIDKLYIYSHILPTKIIQNNTKKVFTNINKLCYNWRMEKRTERAINVAALSLLDKLIKDWNNYIGDMLDEEKEKMTYLECTGALWGIVANYRIAIEDKIEKLT